MAKTKLEEARRRWGAATIIKGGGAGQKPPPAPKQVPQGPAGADKPPAA